MNRPGVVTNLVTHEVIPVGNEGEAKKAKRAKRSKNFFLFILPFFTFLPRITLYLLISCPLTFFRQDQTQTQLQLLHYRLLRGIEAGSYQMSAPSVSSILSIARAVYRT